MKVERIVQSIQSDGPMAGRPAVFLYLGKNGKEATKEQVVDGLLKTVPSNLLVVRGDEPLEQMEELGNMTGSLLRLVKDNEKLYFNEIEVETGGMIIPTQNMYWFTTSFIVTPRIFTEESAKRFDLFWHTALNVTSVKLLIKSKKDIDKQMNWIKKLVKSNVDPHDIFVVPDTVKDEDIRRISNMLIPICIENGFRFGIKLINLGD